MLRCCWAQLLLVGFRLFAPAFINPKPSLGSCSVKARFQAAFQRTQAVGGNPLLIVALLERGANVNDSILAALLCGL